MPSHEVSNRSNGTVFTSANANHATLAPYLSMSPIHSQDLPQQRQLKGAGGVNLLNDHDLEILHTYKETNWCGAPPVFVGLQPPGFCGSALLGGVSTKVPAAAITNSTRIPNLNGENSSVSLFPQHYFQWDSSSDTNENALRQTLAKAKMTKDKKTCYISLPQNTIACPPAPQSYFLNSPPVTPPNLLHVNAQSDPTSTFELTTATKKVDEFRQKSLRMYHCYKCPQVFRRNQDLVRHLGVTHSVFFCQHCQLIFRKAELVNMHYDDGSCPKLKIEQRHVFRKKRLIKD
ncbi:hypothetical protein HK100_003730 [Physocladia obscura]|uniref:C2H2-type domain-containing protein n=1 Tax=Physocladia obscura TaxID=109957 RepID=A0AAD5SWL6_9FUNG|nr:hypothetical protein HK100_003730 [Physocladia obscura]